MRPKERILPLILLAFLIPIALVPLGCQGSNSVTSPSMGAAAPAASIAGAWSGTYLSYDPTGCGNSSATATFQQDGATVTGIVSTSSCGVAGYFKGTIQGNMLLGSIAMEGCVGGGASGTVSGSEISLTIGDLTKPLITGDKPVMFGGAVSLHR